MTSPAHGTCAVSRAGPHERIVPGTRSARSANRTRSVQQGELHTRPHVNPSVPNSYNTRHLHSPSTRPARIRRGAFSCRIAIAQTRACGPCVKSAMDLVRANARTRRGCQINPLRPSRLAFLVSHLNRSASHLHTCAHAFHDTRILHTLQHALWDNHIGDSC